MILRVASHKIYPGPLGELIVFNEELPGFSEVDNFTLKLLDSFSLPSESSGVVKSFPQMEQVKTEEVIKQLLEVSLLIEDGAFQSKENLCNKVNLKISAFRVVLTEQCNLACAECFVTKHKDYLVSMSISVLEKVIRQTSLYGKGQRITYHFFGGEPLICFNHIKRAVEIVERAVVAGEILSPIYAITTNLTFLDDDSIELFRKYGFKVGVSVDGPPSIHNKFRAFKDGSGTFEVVEHNYQRLLKAGIEPYVLITPHLDLFEELPDIFVEVLCRFPMKEVTINTPFDYDTFNWNIPGAKYARTLMNLVRIAKSHGIKVDSAISPAMAVISEGSIRRSPCSISSEGQMLSIAPDGRLSFCPQCWDIRQDFIDASVTQVESSIVAPVRHLRCNDCLARNICGGPCSLYQKKSGLLIDQERCNFMKILPAEIVANLDLFL